MEFDVGLLKFDQILDNIVNFEKEEVIFDIGTSEIFKKGHSQSTLKIRNLLHNRIALRISVPKDRFKVSPICSYLDSQETFTYKFTYIYKEKSVDISKFFFNFEIIITPKIKQLENINPLTLFEHILINNIPVKGTEKKIPIKITNSLFFNNNDTNFSSNSPFLITEKNSYTKYSSKKTIPEVRKEINEDLNDPKIFCELLKQNMVYSASNNTKHLKEDVERKLYTILQKTSFFSKFLHFFRIDEYSLKQAVKYLEYLKVPQNYYLFVQGDLSRYFFGIISGRVSLRIRKKVNSSVNLNEPNPQLLNKKIQIKSKSNNVCKVETYLSKSNPNLKNTLLSFTKYEPLNDSEFLESDYIKLGCGCSFGELGLIYNLTRSTSALVIEDSEFFILSKDNFLNCFGKNIYKTENERKDYLIKCFPIFKDFHRSKIDEMYRKVNIDIVCNNQIIYRENFKADYLYLIIDGECKLEKNLSEKDNDDNSLNAKRVVLLKLGIGDFCGLEHITNSEVYCNYLISSSEATAIMRININLWPDCKDLVIKFLKPFYEQRSKFLKEMLKEYLNKKLTIKYHYKTGPITKNENFKQREEKDKQEKLENIIEKVERKFSSTPTKISNTVVTRSYITSAKITSNNSHILDVKRINTCKDKKKNMLDNFLNKEKMNNELDNARNVNDSYIDQLSFRKNNKAQTQTFTKLTKFRYSKSNFKNINHLEAHNKSEKKKNNSCNNFLFIQKLENRRLKLVSPKVVNNLTEWKNSVATNKFHSGNFELPLYTLTKNEKIE